MFEIHTLTRRESAVKKPIVSLVLAVVLSACASNVQARYPETPSPGSTGTVIVRFTEPIRSVSVRVDGSLVVEDRFTERVEISGIPAGERQVTVTASEGRRKQAIDHTERVVVRAGEPAAILVATPPFSTGYWIESAIGTVVTGAILIFADIFD